MRKPIIRLLTLTGIGIICLVAVQVAALANPLGVPDSEYNALVDLYNSTGGPNWHHNDNWLTGNPEWYGVYVENGHVTSLDLSKNNLTGSLPAAIGNLPSLFHLDMCQNQLSGQLPIGLTDLKSLFWLNLSDNQLCGAIPSEMSGMNLYYLYLDSNQFTGCIPEGLANLANLYGLGLSDNQLTGEIPSGLGNLTNLCFLYLDHNQLSGSIPAELGNLASMSEFSLSNNLLSGGIPSELGNFSHCTQLYLNNNHLSGSIPAELGNLTNCSYLYLNDNQLSGSIPSELGQLNNLYYLCLENNQLSGSIPDELGSISWLTWLDLSNNRLSGAIPQGLGSLQSLGVLLLNGNQLSGDVPQSLSYLPLWYGWSSIDYNALSCADPDLRLWLDQYFAGWQDTQTVAPTDVSAVRSGTSAKVSWTPIAFNWQDGYYEVGYSYSPGGPYTFETANRTRDKSAEQLWIDGLDPNQSAYLVVRTVTSPHQNNQSTLVSLDSSEVKPSILSAGSKLDADGTDIYMGDMVVTAVFPDCCYAENESRTWGIRAESPDGGYPDPGTRVEVYGTMQTNADGERYLLVSDGSGMGTGEIKPLYMTNRALGGGDYNRDPSTGAGQIGVTGGSGLNNIGLLVKTTGSCTYVDDHTFIIDDGSGANVTCETPPTILVNPAWQQVAVTGISSIRQETDGTYSRLVRVTKVDTITSSVPEGITGRWEMTGTSGDMAGVFGLLLVQQGSDVTGSIRGIDLDSAQMDGNSFTGSFVIDYQDNAQMDMTWDGQDTLTGTLSMPDKTIPVTFHRVSPDPASPYTGRPHVLDASFDGSSLNVTWDRPINGWDYGICASDGQDITDWSSYDNSYDPTSHTFHMRLSTTTPLVPGEHYTIYLESQGDDQIDWNDPYGSPAWDYPEDCYSFSYTYQQLPSAPDFAIGSLAPGMPGMVAISSSWPDGCDKLKLYQSVDGTGWQDTGLTATQHGGDGEFVLSLSTDAYFRVTGLAGGLEGPPGPVVHARPQQTETNGIIIDTPSNGATDAALAPLISWQPDYTQVVDLKGYAMNVADAATGSDMWNAIVPAALSQTSVIYGVTSGIQAGPAAPLATGGTYNLVVGALDSENWIFAFSPQTQFTTVANTGGQGDIDAIHALYESIKTSMETHDLNSLMALFSQDYLHNGDNWAALQSNMGGGISDINSVDYAINNISFAGNRATVTASIVVTFGDGSTMNLSEPDSSENGIGMGWLIQENGTWRVYGDQLRSRVELHTVRQPDGSYGLRFQASGDDLVSGTVSGPGVDQAPLYWDGAWNDFRQWVVPSQTPMIGDMYTLDLTYGDGQHETVSSFIRSFVPVSPSVNAEALTDGSIVFNWQDISSQVPGAAYYTMFITDGQSNYVWSADSISLDTTSITTPPLAPGQTYRCELCIFDDCDDAASSVIYVTTQDAPPPPPAF